MKRRWIVPSSAFAVIALLLLPVGILLAVDSPAQEEADGVQLYFPLILSGERQEPDTSGASQLSYPVIWADNIATLTPGAATVTKLDGAYEVFDGDLWYYQHDPENLWQAQSMLGSDYLALAGTEQVLVDWIDWGDNLESKDWCLSQVVRVETVLYQELPEGETMDGYPMMYWEGEGPSEVWLMNRNVYTSTDALVFTPAAHLTIQKIITDTEDPLTWDPENSQWVGTGASAPIFNGAVHEADDGSGSYNAEINVAGKIIFGFNWKVRDLNDGVGTYRLTFSLDSPDIHTDLADITGFAPNTSFNEAQIKLPTEEEIAAILAEEPLLDAETSPNTAVVVPEDNLTYIDIQITPTKGGGGGH